MNYMHPVFAIDEETHEIVYANEVITKERKDIVGKPCYAVFWNNDSPCPQCPQSGADCREQWECVDPRDSKSYHVCSYCRTYENRKYRVVMAEDNSETMDLSRSVVDYLWLMQQLSAMQVEVMHNQAKTFEVIVAFLCSHFRAERVCAALKSQSEAMKVCCTDADGVVAMDEHEGFPPGGEQFSLNVRNANLRLHELLDV